jgi:acetyl-CoA carboxylase biotin carboxyl carrier protein
LMFKLSEIKELIKLLDQSSLQELEIQNEGYRLSIRKPNKTESVILASTPASHTFAPAMQPSALPQQTSPVPALSEELTTQTAQTNLHTIVSPMVGTFYEASSPDVPAYVSTGSKVKEKTVVCIVEAMKLMNEIEAEIKGEIVDILVENGQLVEYGQPLFLVKPE